MRPFKSGTSQPVCRYGTRNTRDRMAAALEWPRNETIALIAGIKLAQVTERSRLVVSGNSTTGRAHLVSLCACFLSSSSLSFFFLSPPLPYKRRKKVAPLKACRAWSTGAGMHQWRWKGDHGTNLPALPSSPCPARGGEGGGRGGSRSLGHHFLFPLSSCCPREGERKARQEE